MISYGIIEAQKWNSSMIPFQQAIRRLKRRFYAKVTTPVSWCTHLPIRPTWLLAFHLLGLGFWMSRVLSFMSNIKKDSGASLKSFFSDVCMYQPHLFSEITTTIWASVSVLQFYSFILFHLFNRRYCSVDISVVIHISFFILFILLISSFCS